MIFNVIPKVRFGGTECSHEFNLLKSIFSTGADSPETENRFRLKAVNIRISKTNDTKERLT
ncbi:hypothetical protein LCA02_23580 [Lacticaseibacillus casei]|nr:hypothetical protein LCA02_23580 [Lacticaseibacillus casei]